MSHRQIRRARQLRAISPAFFLAIQRRIRQLQNLLRISGDLSMLDVTPKLAVTAIGNEFVIIGLASIARRILSASPSVPIASEAGTTIRNSSPP